MRKKKAYMSARPFFDKVTKDPETRILFEEEKSKTEIAYMVRATRLKAGLTQSELAKKIGSSQSALARLESGLDKRVPTLSLLARIAAACDADFEFGFRFHKVS